MKRIALAIAVVLSAAAAPAAAQTVVAGNTPQLVWQQVYNGAASGGFSWAHSLSLDASDETLYAVGKSSEVFGAVSFSVSWDQGFAAATGQPDWAVNVTTGLLGGTGGLFNTAMEEEMAVSLVRWPDGNLLRAGRYPGSPGSRLWTGDRRVLSPTAAAAVSNSSLAGATLGTSPNNFSPPIRGMGVALPDSSGNGWSVGVQNSAYPEADGYIAVDYVFSKFSQTGVQNGGALPYVIQPLILNQNWAGDCCYDPPLRTAIGANDTANGRLFSLGGSFYDPTTGSYGFNIMEVPTVGASAGQITSFSYEGTQTGGRSVADALIASSDGSEIFVLAKTSETGRGYGSRLFAFSASGTQLWEDDLTTDTGLMSDAVLAMTPGGVLRVIESTTGKLLTFNTAGNSSVSLLQLPLPALNAGATFYIGAAAADNDGNLYVSGTLNNGAWVADYNNLVQPAAPSCGILGAYSYPNPFNSNNAQATIYYDLFAASNVTVTIYDQIGAQVRSWGFGSGATGGMAGANTFTWDGSSSSGRKVVRGMYTARVSVSPNNCQNIFSIGVMH